MQLHKLQPSHYGKFPKRVGRGGKRGTTSGRGQKGQKSRSGHKIRPAIRDLIIRLPKLRGFKNKSIHEKTAIVSLAMLSKIQSADITRKTLVENGLVSKNFKGAIKILGDGEIKKILHVKGVGVSKSARIKIEAAGGNIAGVVAVTAIAE